MRQNSTAILNYNDFNDNEREAKAIAIASMVKEFNERYAADWRQVKAGYCWMPMESPGRWSKQ
jgi:hypothetical protein